MEAPPPGPSAAPPPQQPDRLGDVLRGVLGSAAVRAGSLAALATVTAVGVVALLLSFVPWNPLQEALGIAPEDETVPTQGRIAHSLLFPWLANTTFSGEGFEASIRALAPVPTLVLLVVLVGAGLLVRRLVPPIVSHRVVALLVSAVVSALVVCLLAATLGYSVDDEGFVAEFEFSPGLYASVALVEVLLVGAFAFGVVALWPAALSVPARTAAVLVGGVLAVGVLVFPPFVTLGPTSGQSAGRDGVQDAARISPWAPGAASSALPLALGAHAHLETEESSPPFNNVSRDDFESYVYWPGLARYTEENESARLWGYTDAGGAAWDAVLVLGSLLLLVLWALAAVRVVRVLGAPRAVDGLVRGGLLGLIGAVLLVAVAWLSRVSLEIGAFPGLPGPGGQLWGMTAGGTLQAAATLIVLTGLSGAVYAAFRPAPYRVEPWTRGASFLRRLREQGPAPTPGDAEFCGRCGTAFPGPETAFCTRCGAPRGAS